MLLVLVAWTGASTAENQEGDLQLTERVGYCTPWFKIKLIFKKIIFNK